jgi:hypothetical protein
VDSVDAATWQEIGGYSTIRYARPRTQNSTLPLQVAMAAPSFQRKI